jgi:hypothetical protein
MKTAELTGAILDYWVAKAGEEWKRAHHLFPTMTLDPTFSGVDLRDYPRGEYGASIQTCILIPRNPFRQDPQPFCPSIAWDHGGPIIEREKIEVRPGSTDGLWFGSIHDVYMFMEGPTPLIAAMRCFVASKFGEEVES